MKRMKAIIAVAVALLDDAAYLGGLVLLSVGAGRIYSPAALLVLGAGLVAYGLLIARKGG